MSLMPFQWWHVSAEIYLANRSTTNEISSLVHLAKYNKEQLH